MIAIMFVILWEMAGCALRDPSLSYHCPECDDPGYWSRYMKSEFKVTGLA